MENRKGVTPVTNFQGHVGVEKFCGDTGEDRTSGRPKNMKVKYKMLTPVESTHSTPSPIPQGSPPHLCSLNAYSMVSLFWESTTIPFRDGNGHGH
ncbi:unnamed protein product [Rhizophagus irregularis]|nr:unnamed protein product [Rhizophagus irregularis]